MIPKNINQEDEYLKYYNEFIKYQNTSNKNDWFEYNDKIIIASLNIIIKNKNNVFVNERYYVIWFNINKKWELILKIINQYFDWTIWNINLNVVLKNENNFTHIYFIKKNNILTIKKIKWEILSIDENINQENDIDIKKYIYI